MNIITGYRGTPHISAQQDRDYHRSTFGTGTYILNIGSKMVATVISANEVQVADGLIMAQGCLAEIAQGTVESLTISNGEQGMYRTDLIVLRYTRNSSTGVEDMELVVIEGTSASSSPETPSYTSGSIANGDVLVDFPLYKVNISGITIASVTPLVSKRTIATGEALSSLSSTVSTLRTSLTSLTSTVSSIISQIGSTAMGTEASTLTGAIHEVYLRSVNDRSTLTSLVSKIGSTAMGTTASTITGAVKELLAMINNDRSKIGSSTLNTQAQTIIGAINELLLRSENDRSKTGYSTLNTEAQTIIGAINELLLRSQNDRASASTLSSKVTTLETKTQGISGTRQYTVMASDKTYVPLQTASAYMIIINAYSTSDALRGMYLVGVNSAKAMGITTVKSASSVALADVNNGILRITNNGGTTLRVTVITTSGTIPT